MKRHHRRVDNEAAAADEDLRQRLASLQLPHMPEYLSRNPAASSSSSSFPKTTTGGKSVSPATESLSSPSIPSLRILVVADLDLPSAAALAEYTLQQRNQVFDANRIDMCIACGPLAREQDLQVYRRSSRRRQRPGGASSSSHRPPMPKAAPFVRSREETAALEGLVTAALSQLENIVCRVVFCPGATDPLTTIIVPASGSDDGREKLRLTPNSRNVHQQWLPIAPSLGCGGLLYLKSLEQVVLPSSSQTKTNTHNNNNSTFQGDDDESDKEEGEGSEEEILSERIVGMQQSPEGYCSTLTRLLQIAPPSAHSLPFASEKAQTILVTHYVDLDTSYEDDVPANGSPSWAIEADLPWPIQDHDSFLKSPMATKQLCLEIASGSSAKRPREWRKHPNGMSVLLPGSLRERGEFCFVDIALVEVAITDATNDEDSLEGGHDGTPKFCWKVTNVDWHTLP